MCRGFEMKFYVCSLQSELKTNNIEEYPKARRLFYDELADYREISGLVFFVSDTAIFPTFVEDLGIFYDRPSDKALQLHPPCGLIENNCYAPVDYIIKQIILMPIQQDDIEPLILVDETWIFPNALGTHLLHKNPQYKSLSYKMTTYMSLCPINNGIEWYRVDTTDDSHTHYSTFKDGALGAFWAWFIHLLDVMELYTKHFHYLAKHRKVYIDEVTLKELLHIKQNWDEIKAGMVEMYTRYSILTNVAVSSPFP